MKNMMVRWRYSTFIKQLSEMNYVWLFGFACICAVVAYIYLDDLSLALPFMLIGYLMEKSTSLDRKKKKKREELKQFRIFIDIVNGAMTATNKAVELCFEEALDCMSKMHMTRTKLYKELIVMQRNLKTNYQASFDKELISLAIRMDNQEILQFARAVEACFGIDNHGIVHVIRNTSSLIQEKCQIEDDIYACIAETKNQAYIMLLAPVMLLTVVKWQLPDYLLVMREDPSGFLILAGGLMINYAVFFWVQHIVRKGT